MVRREQSPELVNAISNASSVFATLSSRYSVGERIDWSAAFPMTRTGVVVLTNGEDAAQVYELKADRVWEVCTIFADTCRGKRALQAGYEMRDWIKPHADLVYGSIPDSLPQAKWFYRQMGGRPVESVNVGGEAKVANHGEELFAWKVAH